MGKSLEKIREMYKTETIIKNFIVRSVI